MLSDLILPRVEEAWCRMQARRRRVPQTLVYDPGRERRAEARARALLRSCVNEEEWAMYRDLGFIRVWGSQADGPADADGTGGGAYPYILSPPRPLVSYPPPTPRQPRAPRIA